MPQTILERLRALDACSDARVWAAALPPDATEEAAWLACERADWLLWIAASLGVDRSLVVLAACACARTALPMWERQYPEDRRPHTAIETAEAWARGEASLKQVRKAADAAVDAADDAADAAADAAAYAASAAAYAAALAAAAAAYAAYAAVDAADAAAAVDAADAAATRDNPRTMSDIVRQHIPWSAVAAQL